MAERAIAGTLVGCVGCMMQIESISKTSPGCMNLMTFATFVFISFVGLVQQSKFFTVFPKNCVPISSYLRIVVLFFLINVGNNLSLNFDISVPLFIIFRSGTLLANLVLGRLLKNRIYSWSRILSVLCVTCGIVLFTVAGSEHTRQAVLKNRSAWLEKLPFPPIFIGVALLVSALFTSSYLGLCQEDLYRSYGKHSQEAMFFVHALSLPGFYFLSSDISSTAARFNQSEYFSQLLPIPRLWFLLATICFFQWMCITHVYTLTSLTSSLNVTMVVTLRKFVSLGLSIYVFENPFNIYHFIGALLVFVGTLGFTEFWSCKMWAAAYGKKKLE